MTTNTPLFNTDIFVGSFYRAMWQRRLNQAGNNYGYVAKQMRKTGVPVELALLILLH